MRKEPNLLDDVADAPPQFGHVLGQDIHAVQQDLARRRLDEPVDHLETRGLAAAGWSDENADGAGRDLERQVVHGTMRLLAVAIALGDAAELE